MTHRHVLLTLLALLLLAPFAAATAQRLPTGQPAAGDDTQAPGQWLHIIKSPDPLYVARGGRAEFTIVVLNTSDVFAMRDVVVSDPLVPDCSLTIGPLAASGEFSYTCAAPSVQASFTNLATVTGTNATNNKQDTATDTADVQIVELTVDLSAQPASLPEPGGPVDFTLVVRNTGAGPATLSSLTSPQFGDLTATSNPLLSNNTCAALLPLPQLFPGGQPLSCSFTAVLEAQPGSFEVVVNAGALAGGVFPFQSTGQTSVAITDLPSELAVTLAAAAERVPLGGPVDLAVTLTNNSAVDTITIVNMSDSELGDVTANGSCAVPLMLAPGAVSSCAYSQPAAGPMDATAVYTFTASGVNDDQPPAQVSAQASAEVFVYQPMIFMPALANPLNNSCTNAYQLELNRVYEFTPAFVNAWYTFTLTERADIVALITNYVPRIGQMIIYSANGPNCLNAIIEGNDGSFTDVKRVELPNSRPNRYYLRVITDGELNDEIPYTLRVSTR